MNVVKAAALAVLLLLPPGAGFAQQRVAPANRYERVIAVVPLVGRGTRSDPKRPLYAPAPREINAVSRNGIIGFTYLTSDDGHFALVEFTALTRAGLAPILADKSIQTFLKGKDKRQDIDVVLKRFKKDFDWDKFVGRMQ
jgi:hypothetical protein